MAVGELNWIGAHAQQAGAIPPQLTIDEALMAVTTASARPTERTEITKKLWRGKRSIAEARQFVRGAFSDLGLSNLSDDGALVVSELVTNVVRHTRTKAIVITLTQPKPGWVRVAVTDKSHAMPKPRTASKNDTTGRGLAVVAAFSARWGVDELTDGKRVWVEWCTGDEQ
ncbi:ATP-binding protein [Streptomyces acidiscabies]|uniref:ATP-binding protein n=1 Tax=Streptomyces acidiscabies TaxID=42234 RepID=UPI0038F6BD4C